MCTHLGANAVEASDLICCIYDTFVHVVSSCFLLETVTGSGTRTELRSRVGLVSPPPAASLAVCQCSLAAILRT